MNNQAVTITVAPNGAYKQKSDHPALPVSPLEIAVAAEQAAAAGATMIHAHARTAQGKHSLDPEQNCKVWHAIKERVGDDIVVQLTTEAAGIYQPEQQMQLIRQVKPEAASFALRELFPDDSSIPTASAFFHWVAEQHIIAQYILYSAEEVSRYHQLKAAGILPDTPHHLLFVLGRYHQQQQSSPEDLAPFIAAHRDETPWMVCAFGQREHACASRAMELGGDVRVGFENNLLDNQGQSAANNAVLVQQVTAAAANLQRPLLSAQQFRQKFGL
ncbi:MAG: 3-keto-5-aminohexanoate cleavage protein [Amphritea sp.]